MTRNTRKRKQIILRIFPYDYIWFLVYLHLCIMIRQINAICIGEMMYKWDNWLDNCSTHIFIKPVFVIIA